MSDDVELNAPEYGAFKRVVLGRDADGNLILAEREEIPREDRE